MPQFFVRVTQKVTTIEVCDVLVEAETADEAAQHVGELIDDDDMKLIEKLDNNSKSIDSNDDDDGLWTVLTVTEKKMELGGEVYTDYVDLTKED